MQQWSNFGWSRSALLFKMKTIDGMTEDKITLLPVGRGVLLPPLYFFSPLPLLYFSLPCFLIDYVTLHGFITSKCKEMKPSEMKEFPGLSRGNLGST